MNIAIYNYFTGSGKFDSIESEKKWKLLDI